MSGFLLLFGVILLILSITFLEGLFINKDNTKTKTIDRGD